MSDPRRLCAITGARGPGGNVQTMLTRLLETAGSLGGSCEQFSLLAHPVSPIADCRNCDRYHGCTRYDDAPLLLDKMLDADVIVLASPIYWGGPSSQLKAFIDRWSCVPDAEMRERIAGKQLVGLAAYGIDAAYSPAPFQGVLENLCRYFLLPPLEFLAVYCDRHGDAAAPHIVAAVDSLARRLVV